MLKKALIAGAILAASSAVAFANGGSVQPSPHHTFYIGAAVSRDIGLMDTFATNRVDTFLNGQKGQPDVQVGLNTASTDVKDLSGDGIDGNFYAGYGWYVLQHYYIGVEGFGTISNLKGHADTSAGKLSFDSDWSAGVSLIPGMMIMPHTMLYARIGYRYADFDFKASGPGTNNGFLAVNKKDEGQSGIELGVGAELLVWHNIGIRGEWDWSRFSDVDASATSSNPVKIPVAQIGNRIITRPGTQVTKTEYHIQPTIDEFQLGIDYHFFG